MLWAALEAVRRTVDAASHPLFDVRVQQGVGHERAGMAAAVDALFEDDQSPNELVSRVTIHIATETDLAEWVVTLMIGPMAAKRAERFWFRGGPLER